MVISDEVPGGIIDHYTLIEGVETQIAILPAFGFSS
jgi:hypothetical protein